MDLLSRAATRAGKVAGEDGIFRPRPNEVGNDMEPYVLSALREVGLRANKPMTESRRKKAVGYPDIAAIDSQGRIVYVEVKTFNIENLNTTFRAFYMSPSDDPKVTQDAVHLLISFQVEVDESRRRGRLNCYVPVAWKIVSLYDMPIDIKHEFQASNLAMYRPEAILREGPC